MLLTPNLSFDPVVAKVQADSPEAALALLPGITKAVENALNMEGTAVLPSRSGAKRGIQVPFKKIFTSNIEVKGATVEVTLVFDAALAEPFAYAWCEGLTKIPPKDIPRGQRMGANLMKRLSEHKTGNNLVDKGRKAVLDNTVARLAPGLIQGATWHLNRALEAQTGA